MKGYCEDCDIKTDKLRVEEIKLLTTPRQHWQRRCSHCKRVAIGLTSEYTDKKMLTKQEKDAILNK